MKKLLSKIRLRTKILSVFLLICSMQIYAGAYSQNIKVSLRMKNASMEEVFHRLEKITNYTFLYKNEIVKDKKNINIDANNEELNQVLDKLLSSKGLTYVVDDNVVIIKQKESSPQQATQQRRPAERTVTGTVTDDENQPLIGVTIVVGSDNRRATITDVNGNYRINVPAEGSQTLVFSYIGMEPQTISVGDKNVINVRMISSSTDLSDIVIEGGYGLAQKRSDMVGSAFQVSAEQIKNLPATRIDNLLEGMVPGLAISVNSDSDGATRPRMSARIRGEGSLSASSEPIWIVDGTRIYTGGIRNAVEGVNTTISPLSFLNPDDIESFTVLKDASMVSLYGADGSNGVILVTTKKGTVSKPRLNLTARFGISKINNSTKFKVLNGEEYMTLAKEAYSNRYQNDMTLFPYQDLPNNPYSSTSTDWYDVFYDTGNSSEVNFSYRGGNENIRNFISASYFRNEMTLKGNDQQRYSVRTNTDIKLHRKLTFSLISTFSYNTSNIFSPGTDYLKFLPIYSPYNEDGTYRMYNSIIEADSNNLPVSVNQRFRNSVPMREENDYKQRAYSNITNATLNYDVWDGLRLAAQFGIDYKSIHENRYNAMSNWSGRNSEGQEIGYAYRNSPTTLLWNAVLRLNYNRTFGKHTVGGLLGTEALSKDYKLVASEGDTFANDHIKEVTYAVNRKGSSNRTVNHSASFFGQGSYSYDERYYFNVNTRRDGNSDFGEDVQWAQFWSVGGAWNIHNENFFNSKVVNILKLKASYGTAGNSRLGDVQAKGLYSYGYSYNGVPASTMNSIKNRKLSWETSYITNIGLRVKLFNRLDIEIEAYNKKTDDLINSTATSFITGVASMDTNVGSLRNRGFEITIESQNLDMKDFKWYTSLNMSHTKNKILSLNVSRLGSDNKVWEVGGDKNTWRLVRWAGVDPRNGDALWYDKDGNITNKYDVNNAVPYKSSVPDLEGGMSNEFIYKNFSLNILIAYQIGGYAFSTYNRNLVSDGRNIQTENQSVNQLDRWQKAGDLAISPKPIWGISTGSTQNSTRYLYNKTHFRLKNIALGYQIPDTIIKRAGFERGNAVLTIDDIVILTPYNKSGRNSHLQSMRSYPMDISFSLGLNLAF